MWTFDFKVVCTSSVWFILFRCELMVWERMVILVGTTYNWVYVVTWISNNLNSLQNEIYFMINPLNVEWNPIRHLLALVGARHFVHVSRMRVNSQINSDLTYVGIKFLSDCIIILLRYVIKSDKVFEELKLIVCRRL